jgi:hypothetical protein
LDYFWRAPFGASKIQKDDQISESHRQVTDQTKKPTRFLSATARPRIHDLKLFSIVPGRVPIVVLAGEEPQIHKTATIV